MKYIAKGFTLIEVMITVAIISILTAIALPQYSQYVTRSRLTDAFSALGGVQLSAEQYWANNRTYVGLNVPSSTSNFSYALSNATASSFTVTATGNGSVSGFVFTIDQSGNRATTGVPSGWAANASCWVDHKGGQCSQ